MYSGIKNPKYDLKNYYRIFWELGVILSLVISIGLTKIDFQSGPSELNLNVEREVVTMEEIVQTDQQERPPAPPRPQVPVAVPNDEVFEEVEITIDAEMDMDEALDAPPPQNKEAEEKEEEDFFVAVEQMPKMKTSLGDLQKRITYPERARMAGIEGRVIVQFIVDETGGVESPHVIREIGGGCDEEALRVVQYAEFEPGKQRGVPVRVQYSLPITFMLRK